MPNEIERKFLLKNDTWREQIVNSIPIIQGYIYFSGGIVRLRTCDKQAFMTLKTPNNGMKRQEFEYAIPVKDAEELLQDVCKKPLIEKTRHIIKDRNHTWEVDEFYGENKGLIVAEVELKTTTEKIQRPSWLGKEVTNDPIYYNSNLVAKPFSQWNTTDRLAGFRPQSYSPILNIKLQPKNGIGEEIKKIYTRLLWIAEKNEKGIIDDIDPDFLHDFRVAVRKTRTLLGQFKQVFPKKITSQYKKEFANLAKTTNQLRDLDVFILRKTAYEEELTEALRQKLKPLFTDLAKERQQEYEKALAFMTSPEYRNLKKSWQTFLNSKEESQVAKIDMTPAIKVAKLAIKKAHLQVIKAGSCMTGKSPAKEFHALRIKCKKLRYTLEAFSSFFDNENVWQLMRQLKSLQDNLGFANDLSIQTANIKRLSPNKKNSKKAVKSLLDLLDTKQKILRAEFKDVFANFASKKNKHIFKELGSLK